MARHVEQPQACRDRRREERPHPPPPVGPGRPRLGEQQAQGRQREKARLLRPDRQRARQAGRERPCYSAAAPEGADRVAGGEHAARHHRLETDGGVRPQDRGSGRGEADRQRAPPTRAQVAAPAVEDRDQQGREKGRDQAHQPLLGLGIPGADEVGGEHEGHVQTCLEGSVPCIAGTPAAPRLGNPQRAMLHEATRRIEVLRGVGLRDASRRSAHVEEQHPEEEDERVAPFGHRAHVLIGGGVSPCH